jgi:hypothetical protein
MVVKDDYEVLTREVQALVDKKITRMAIVGDKKWQKRVTHLAAPFYAGEAQYFDAEDAESAWARHRDLFKPAHRARADATRPYQSW